ncbi:hypothetical protein POTOM_009890 [Populus tomentosa]|uniref:Uncharacterized protein n=1 Tax=Populus tomentosa TaxID=118781 RepID=A0A8X8DC36_POPTO|nr:hypothetical protein POTOM_009890 [Populus tomentosa]
MNIKEISTISVQAKDIPEDILAIEHPANEITQEVAGGSCSSLTRSLAPLQQKVLGVAMHTSGKIEAQAHALESTEQQLSEAYNRINLLKRRVDDLKKKQGELKGAKDILKEELKIACEEVYKSHVEMENLKNSS